MISRWTVLLLVVAFCFGFTAAKSRGHNKVHLLSNQTKVSEPPRSTHPPPTPPPTPPPPKSCADDGKCAEEHKKCNADLKCVCDVHFRENIDGSCIPKPQLGEQCFVDNVSWLECDGDGVDPNCQTDGPNKGKCVCSKSHEPSGGGKQCSPIKKKLGESCGHDAECIAAYSQCAKGQCACIEGFKADGDVCKANEYRCPTGQAKEAKGAVALCEVDFNETTGTIGDNCGSGYSCFVPPHTLTASGKPHGHCCPNPTPADSAQLTCPYGDPLKNASCPDRKKADSKQVNTCPAYSHACFSVQSRPHDMICCPSPCRQPISHFNHDGQCFEYSLLGRACELTAQCTGDAICGEAEGAKKCRCKKGYAQVSANQCEETR